MLKPSINNYRLFHHEGDIAIDNDLMVGGSLTVAQHARFKRTVYVEGTLVYRHLRGMDCGLFDTIEALQRVHPSPHRGQWAIVGTTVDQLALYTCLTHGVWTLLSEGQSLSEALHYDDFITGPITLDKVPEIQQYIDSLILTEIETRQAAIAAEQAAREAAITAEQEARQAAIAAEQAAREAAIAAEREARVSDILAERAARQTAISDLMMENGIHELRFVNIWADDGNLPSTFAGYAWHGTAHVLYHRSGTLVEAEMPRTDVLYVDTERNRLLRWNGQEMILLGGDQNTQNNPSDQSNPNTPSTPNTPNTPSIPNIPNTPIFRGFGEPDFQDPLRPEYYLVMDGQLVRESAEKQAQVKWGTAYYDWPLRCFNGEIDDEITIQSGSYDGEVFMPSERIIHKHGVEMQFTTDDVLYSTHHGCFVLKVVDGGTTKYYKKWGNFYEWTTKPVNGVATYKPRIDCVFSDIHLEDDPDVAGVVSPTSGTDFTPEATGQSRRHSYIWDNSQSAFVDITTLMTDFTKAVHDCLASTVGGKVKGDMRLSDRIYYIGDLGRFADNKIATYGTGKVCIWNGNAYDVRKLKPVGANQMDQDYITGISAAEGFTIDGGKGVLFYRAHTMFTPNSHGTTLVTAFNLGAAKNCVLRNLTLRVLRDRDNSSVAGEFGSSSNVAFSCSDSCMKAFAFGNTSENILLDNIDLQGFFEDFDGKDHLGHDITVRNLRSRDVMVNVNSGTGWTFENCDIAQRECAGIGAHVFYPQGIWQAVFRNCRIRQGRYTSVAIGLHEIRNVTRTIDGESVTTTGYADLLFDGCQIEGGYLFEGDNSDSHDLSTVTLRKSRVTQLYDMAMYDGGEDSGYGAVTRTVSCKRGAWIMEECSLELLTGSVFADFNSGGREATSVILRDTDVNTQKPSEGNIIDLSSNNAGKVTFDNVRANYLSGRGGAIYYDPQKCVTLDAINAKVFPNERASGTTVQRPTNIEVGYCYFDTSLGSGTPPNGKPIWASKITESTDIITGEVTRSVTWVDATGTVV